jgi:hypothetical protein
VRGNFTSGELGYYEWEFQGVLTDSGSAETIPADIEDYFSTNCHHPVVGASFDLGAFDVAAGAIGRGFSFDAGNQVVISTDHSQVARGGVGSFYIVQRDVSGEVTIEHPDPSTKDFYADVLVDCPTQETLVFDIGSGTDEVTTFTFKAQWANASRQDNNGITDLVLPWNANESAGNIDDQFAIVLS